MEKFCISTLTHEAPQRKELLQKTIELFLLNTEGIFDWHVLVNSSTPEWEELGNTLSTQYSDRVNFKFYHSPTNLGPGGGINRLNKLTKNYEYTLFLEGDWYHTSQQSTNLPKNWLNLLIQYMDKNQDTDQILLRKYFHDTDDRMYGYGYWISKRNVDKVEEYKGLKLIHLIKKEYTNNPVIRRNQSFYSNEIFPLEEHIGEDGNSLEVKGNEKWGIAEIKAESKGFALKSLYLGYGAFVHGDGYSFKDYNHEGCGSCIYGLLKPVKEWCAMCPSDVDFTNFEIHQQLYEKWHGLKHEKGLSEQEELDLARSLIDNHRYSLEEIKSYFDSSK